jgi:hypothetical protein
MPSGTDQRSLRNRLISAAEGGPKVCFISSPVSVLFVWSDEKDEYDFGPTVITRPIELGQFDDPGNPPAGGLHAQAIEMVIDHIKGISPNNTLVLHTINVTCPEPYAEDRSLRTVVIMSTLVEGVRAHEPRR